MRNSIWKRAAAAAATLAMAVGLTTPAGLAAGAGTTLRSSTITISDSLKFVNTVSTHSAGRQESYTLSYYPYAYDQVKLITYNSNPIYGNTTITAAAADLEAQGYYVLGGVNADFFYSSLPMGMLLENRHLVSSDSGETTLAFREDGSAFVSNGHVGLSLYNDTNGEQVTVHHYNKIRQSGYLYLLSSEFSDTNKATLEGRNVLFSIVDGSLEDITVSCQVKLKVEAFTTESTATAIPENCLLLTANSKCPYYDELLKFTEGDEVTLTVSCDDEALLEAVWATGCGDVLVKDGAVTDASAWDSSISQRNPRTAVGIMGDGTVRLYVLDGRRSSYSNGLTLADLAEEFVNQGCVTAVNLDGGGSTAMLMRMPGADSYSVVNSPSDGVQRACSTYIFLVTDGSGSGTAKRLYFDQNDPVILAGSTVDLSTIYARDSGYQKVATPGDLIYSVMGMGEITENGVYTAPIEPGTDTIMVYSPSTGASGDIQATVINDVSSLTVNRKDTGAAVTSLSLGIQEQVTLVPQVIARGGTCLSSLEAFTFETSGEIGTITPEGLFQAAAIGGEGSITVSGGGAAVTIPVTVGADVTPPVIQLSYEEGNLTAVLSDNSGLPFEAANVVLTVDGLSYPFVLAGDTLNAQITLEEAGIHRITVEAADASENLARASLDVTNQRLDSGFSDVAEDHWAAEYIRFLADRGIVTGSGEGMYSPDDVMTRAAFCTMLCRYLGVDPEIYTNIVLPFQDNDTIPQWAEGYVKAMYTLGYVSGRTDFYGEPIFAPDEAITRGEIFTLIGRLAGGGYENGCDTTFADQADIADWALSGVRTAVAMGVVNGYEDGTIRAGGNASRSEVAKILFCLY